MCHGSVTTGVVNISVRRSATFGTGTGVCLDTPCIHVLTNYHVAAVLGSDMKVEGVAVKNTQMFTSPQDAGATEVQAGDGTIRYNPARDLALVTLAAALPVQFKGLPFAGYQPRVGQQIVRSARFGKLYDVAAGKIVTDTVAHVSAAGVVTSMPKHFLLDCPSRPGNSGGVVMDAAGNVIGMVAMRSTDAAGQVGTIALSAALVSDFLKSANETLWSEVFPAREMAAERDSLPAGLGSVVAPVAAQPELIAGLRAKAGENARAMREVIAVESVETWGQDQARRSWLFRIAMYSDGQKYQKIDANGTAGRELATSSLSWPRMTGVVPGEQWSIVARLLDDAAIEHLGSSVYEGHAVNVFRYTSSATGCASRDANKEVFAGCAGVVVADERLNALLFTQRMTLPSGRASSIRWTEKYRVLAVGNREVLLPTELEMSGDFRTGKTYFASARWSGYRVFAAEAAVRFE
jgi:hypothetical protein